jgi:RNA polymerase-binding transcription factor DksA
VEYGFDVGDQGLGADSQASALDSMGGVPEGDGSGLADLERDIDIDVSVLDAIEQELADVERALALLDEGTYGQCETCGQTVDDAVLARAPATRFCPDHLPLGLH